MTVTIIEVSVLYVCYFYDMYNFTAPGDNITQDPSHMAY